ncbi:YdhW family putative oxidoreductase system protein [Musicola paradisiaca]|nr:YdhW family putative oxidoreductase system protein [Musicola paradisiaca]
MMNSEHHNDACETPPDSVADPGLRRLLLPFSQHAQRPTATPAEVPPSTDEPLPAFMALAEYIRQSSLREELVARSTLAEPPFALTPEQAAQQLAEIQASEACTDIRCIAQDEEAYYYSGRSISDNYARILACIRHQDICRTVAESVRFECRTYPRPYQLRMLQLAPYNLDNATIDSALAAIARTDEFRDIHTVLASNGTVYLYSDRFMSSGKAQGLCEWLEVEQYENP